MAPVCGLVISQPKRSVDASQTPPHCCPYFGFSWTDRNSSLQRWEPMTDDPHGAKRIAHSVPAASVVQLDKARVQAPWPVGWRISPSRFRLTGLNSVCCSISMDAGWRRANGVTTRWISTATGPFFQSIAGPLRRPYTALKSSPGWRDGKGSGASPMLLGVSSDVVMTSRASWRPSTGRSSSSLPGTCEASYPVGVAR